MKACNTTQNARPFGLKHFLGSFCRCGFPAAAVCLDGSLMATLVPSATSARTSQVRRVVRVAAGNALEMYDFQIFAYYAAAIAVTFFPSGNEYASLMLSLATFGAGFLMRPLGAIVLGAYIDHHG